MITSAHAFQGIRVWNIGHDDGSLPVQFLAARVPEAKATLVKFDASHICFPAKGLDAGLLPKHAAVWVL